MGTTCPHQENTDLGDDEHTPHRNRDPTPHLPSHREEVTLNANAANTTNQSNTLLPADNPTTAAETASTATPQTTGTTDREETPTTTATAATGTATTATATEAAKTGATDTVTTATTTCSATRTATRGVTHGATHGAMIGIGEVAIPTTSTAAMWAGGAESRWGAGSLSGRSRLCICSRSMRCL
jgi:hypothetical protein